MAKSAEPRRLRGVSCCRDEELERTDLATDNVDDERRGEGGTEDLALAEGFSADGDARARWGFILEAGDRSLPCIWSRDVREGADVKPVECVSCE